MYSLKDLEDNLKELIKELTQIQLSVSEPHNKTKSNSQLMLLNLPKCVILASICKYLTVPEITHLSSVCTVMRKTIYSPIGWKIISRMKTPYPLSIVYKESDFKAKIKKSDDEIGGHLDFNDYDDEKFIGQERNKFKGLLVRKYSDYLKSKERFEAHLEKIRIEKGLLFKMNQQILYLETIRGELNEQNKQNKLKLKSLSEGFSAKIKEMDDLNDSLNKERTKLQNQKEALANKVREYQHEIEVIKEDSEKSKEILKRLKNYLLYKEL